MYGGSAVAVAGPDEKLCPRTLPCPVAQHRYHNLKSDSGLAHRWWLDRNVLWHLRVAGSTDFTLL